MLRLLHLSLVFNFAQVLGLIFPIENCPGFRIHVLHSFYVLISSDCFGKQKFEDSC